MILTGERERDLAIQRRGLRDFVRMLGASAPDSSVHERHGVSAAVVPVTPGRSLVNSVAYSDPEALIESLEWLAELYESAGIVAWTVWTPAPDGEVVGALEAAGHILDGDPLGMVLDDLEHAELPAIGELDWDSDGDGLVAGELNDRAYAVEPNDGMAAALSAPPEFARQYQARVDGEVACVLGAIDHGGEDLGVYFVATDQTHRGQGLATRLMAAALGEGRERGLRTSSLQASAMGERLYVALGYRPQFRIQLYERRKPG